MLCFLRSGCSFFYIASYFIYYISLPQRMVSCHSSRTIAPWWWRRPVSSLSSLIAHSLEHVQWWERRHPVCSSLSWLSVPLNTSHDDKDVLFVVSPWLPVARPLEESYWGTHVLLVDFVVWPFLCRWCCCSYIKCNGQQNVLITALRGCQNKTSDDLAHWLLTLFVAYQQQSLPFRLLSCLCESLSIKSR
jgi:hypothetical protein